ncbi:MULTISPECIES: rhodanese-like domain-containing protein [Brucella]|mgnify:CR=1 FL=1|uniref:rhodanese-like domain-containing protein n=1 Tax=Brucella TaxID=234 RepID=UPI0039B6CBD0
MNTIKPSDAARMLADGEAVLIDVREPDEFRAEHIAAAASIPLGSLKDNFSALNLSPQRKVIFQCLSGRRGEAACLSLAPIATDLTILNLEGGIAEWKKAGLPVVSNSRAAAIPLFRQVQIAVGAIVAISVAIGFSGWTLGFGIAGFIGCMLVFAGITGWCGMAMLLSRMPWNAA